MDWRQFFKDEELDKAYQIIEVEQRDETDHNSEYSMGSNSNPSEDNLDEEKIYQDVYRMKNVNEIIKTRKQKYEQFVEKVKNEEIAQVEIIGGPLKPKPRETLSESKGILKDKELNKRGKNSSTAQKQKIERINPVIQKL